jgi:hypothetical protein
VPAPPAGATTIVLNWHWACADAPPPLDVAGVTVCTSCNIAISVRVGSPGDTGSVAQTIAAHTAAAATNIAQTIQSALQAAPAPVVSPPVVSPHVIVPPGVSPPVVSLLPPASLAVAPPGLLAAAQPQAQLFPIDAGALAVLPLDGLSATEDPPRRGAPLSFGGAAAPQGQGQGQAQAQLAEGVAGVVATIGVLVGRSVSSPQRSTAERTGAGSRSPVGARRSARPPAPPAAPPSAPTPFVLAAGAPGAQSGGQGIGLAIASAIALVFLYAVYTALRTPPAVPPAARDAGAKPHPPG